MSFFDLQVNGYLGVDFSSEELTEEPFVEACRALLATGTTGFLPTMITAAPALYRRNLGIMCRAIEKAGLQQQLPGFHLEGPFISGVDGARGAHAVQWVHPPDAGLLEDLIRWSCGRLRLLTMAAEVPGAANLCQYAVSKGIRVSLGHQLATYEQIAALEAAGASAMTHLGNALPHQLPRHDNPVYAGMLLDGLTAMIIADGFHLPAHLIRLILKVKTPARAILVSDLSPIAGLPPGRYHTLGNPAELRSNGHLFNPETGFLVGSGSTLSAAAQYLLDQQLATPTEIHQMAVINPRRYLGL